MRCSLPEILRERRLLLLLAGAVLLAASGIARSGESPEGVRVILDRNNLPYSSLVGNPPGLDAEIASELAQRMGQPLQVFWTDTLEEGLLTPVVLSEGEADLAVGVPVERSTVEDRLRVGTRVLYSLPYASTGYVLVTAKNHAPVDVLKDIGRGVIGVEVGSVAASQLWDRGYLLRQFGDQQRILEAIAAGDLEYGVLWANCAWMIEQHETLRDTLRVQNTEIDMLKPRWNVAVALGQHNRNLLPGIDSAIVAMKQDGSFRKIFEKYKIPYFDPFEEGPENP